MIIPFPINLILFFLMSILGSLIVMSSDSSFIQWVGLEVNLMGFIPLCLNQSNFSSTESLTKYFIISAISSSLFLFSSLNLLSLPSYPNSPHLLILLTMMMKLGLPPFHFWFPMIITSLSTLPMYLVLSWQKLAPLFILSKLNNSNLLLLFIISSSVIGSLSGLNQPKLSKLLAYSSISHSAWILLSMMMSDQSWFLYWLIYSLTLLPLIFFIHLYQLKSLNEINNYSNDTKLTLIILLLSLGGFPPLMMFFPKMVSLILFSKMMTLMFIISMFLIISSIINLFFYLRISYSPLLSFLVSKKMKTLPPLNFSFIMMTPIIFMLVLL